jgi:hypothetical protein
MKAICGFCLREYNTSEEAVECVKKHEKRFKEMGISEEPNSN